MHVIDDTREREINFRQQEQVQCANMARVLFTIQWCPREGGLALSSRSSLCNRRFHQRIYKDAGIEAQRYIPIPFSRSGLNT